VETPSYETYGFGEAIYRFPALLPYRQSALTMSAILCARITTLVGAAAGIVLVGYGSRFVALSVSYVGPTALVASCIAAGIAFFVGTIFQRRTQAMVLRRSVLERAMPALPSAPAWTLREFRHPRFPEGNERAEVAVLSQLQLHTLLWIDYIERAAAYTKDREFSGSYSELLFATSRRSRDASLLLSQAIVLANADKYKGPELYHNLVRSLETMALDTRLLAETSHPTTLSTDDLFRFNAHIADLQGFLRWSLKRS
jgi:hypothetical protein